MFVVTNLNLGLRKSEWEKDDIWGQFLYVNTRVIFSYILSLYFNFFLFSYSFLESYYFNNSTLSNLVAISKVVTVPWEIVNCDAMVAFELQSMV